MKFYLHPCNAKGNYYCYWSNIGIDTYTTHWESTFDRDGVITGWLQHEGPEYVSGKHDMCIIFPPWGEEHWVCEGIHDFDTNPWKVIDISLRVDCEFPVSFQFIQFRHAPKWTLHAVECQTGYYIKLLGSYKFEQVEGHLGGASHIQDFLTLFHLYRQMTSDIDCPELDELAMDIDYIEPEKPVELLQNKFPREFRGLCVSRCVLTEDQQDALDTLFVLSCHVPLAEPRMNSATCVDKGPFWILR